MSCRIPVVQVHLVKERDMASEVKQIRYAEDAAKICQMYLDGVDRKHVIVLLLDTKHHRVRGIHSASIGSLDASIIHPREILKPRYWVILLRFSFVIPIQAVTVHIQFALPQQA